MLETVRRWFAKVPEYERDLPLLVVDGVAYTPRAAMTEVERGTDLGRRLQSLIEQMKFGTPPGQEWGLAKLRLKKMLETMPERVLFATIEQLPGRTWTPSQLASEIQGETAIGKQWIENEISHMNYLLRLR